MLVVMLLTSIVFKLSIECQEFNWVTIDSVNGASMVTLSVDKSNSCSIHQVRTKYSN